MTYIRKFTEEVQRQIDEEGLLGISGTHFDKGHSIRRVLVAKQAEYRLTTGNFLDIRKGKFASKALIAKEMLAMFEAIKKGNYETLVFDNSIGT